LYELLFCGQVYASWCVKGVGFGMLTETVLWRLRSEIDCQTPSHVLKNMLWHPFLVMITQLNY